MPSKIELRVATPKDVEAFYGKMSLYSTRAVVAALDGKIVGIGGVYHVGTQLMVFTEIREEMRPYKKDIVRAARMVLEIINRYTMVMAYADPTQTSALDFGKHFGFESTGVDSEHGAVLIRMNDAANTRSSSTSR